MAFIGVIDSGVGGLTILRKLQQSNGYSYVYIADHAFCPYGCKSNDALFSRASLLVKYLKEQGAQAVVLACNTISVFAQRLSQRYAIPVCEVITPTCRQVVELPNVKRVALLATRSTILNGAYQAYLARHCIEVTPFDCSAFVPFVEQRATNTLACQQTLKQSLSSLSKAHVDAIILGCTHFPLIRRQIEYYCDGDKVIECCCNLPEIIAAVTPSKRYVKYLTTGDVDFANLAASQFSNVAFTRVNLN